MFVLPDELPVTTEELAALLSQAQKSINVIQARHEAGEELSKDDVTALRGLLDARDTLTEAHAAAQAEEAAHATDLNELLERAQPAATAPDEPEAPAEPEAPVDEAPVETPVEEPAPEAIAADGRPVTFTGLQAAPETPEVPAGPGWEMVAGAPGYRSGRIGFRDLALALDTVKPGSRKARSGQDRGSHFAQVVAKLSRDVQVVADSHALVAAINDATDERKLPGGSLTAAGGWCAPSEQLYDFCDVPNATDLISLPEVTINRGGIRWPVEPDMSVIHENFQFFFTEPQLEAVDSGDGTPTAFKECVEIPCPDEFVEIRLNAVGYCVEAGILQTQGWPELITWFMQDLAQEHLRAISKRTILDMVSQSGAAKVIPPTSVLGSVASVLNSFALMATNLRLEKGLSRTATIEVVAPSWALEVLRADLALREGTDVFAVSDAQITGWFSARNMTIQLVGDWQTRDTDLPGDLDTLVWPDTVDVLMYPAGTWWRSMSNVIELGIMYPKEQLQVNRYTRMFTEDAYAVGKRCNHSILVTVPLCVSGAVGARQSVECNTES